MTTGCLRIGAVCIAVVGLWSGVLEPQRSILPSPVAIQARVLQPSGTDPSPSLANIKSRGTITFLMHHGAASHFLYRGAQMGFEYEMAQAFAKELGVELEVLTPPPGVGVATWLRAGKGDIAAGLATTDDLNVEPLQVSVPYLETTAQVLTQSEEQTLGDINSLAGKTVSIQPSLLDAYHLLTPSD
ncbi:MAG: transporter substrate-binding domain-containing protein, partial [Candidatus Binatia bacterium]